MHDERLHVIVRRMTLDDIDQVVEIDRLSFPIPWPARSYRYELLNNSRNSTFYVVERASHSPQGGGQPSGWLKRLIGTEPHVPEAPAPQVLAYSGFWHIADEAHISTIAVHPDWRGKKLGELLVWVMVRQAILQGATMVTLEVRVSNTVAQNLYRKYGFDITGLRRGYYHDNHEDAYMMTAAPLDAAYRARLQQYGKELLRHLRIEVAEDQRTR